MNEVMWEILSHEGWGRLGECGRSWMKPFPNLLARKGRGVGVGVLR